MKTIEELAKECGAEFTDWQDDRDAEITFYGGISQLESFAKAYMQDRLFIKDENA